MRKTTIAVAFLLTLTFSARADITGKPVAVDGDTIAIGNERIRLYGIVAPRVNQTCTVDGKEWACGQEATFALAFEMAEHWIACKGDQRDEQGRLMAVCTMGPYDLSALMVRNGWALADRRQSMDYVDEENEARNARRGIWKGGVVPPWAWRKR